VKTFDITKPKIALQLVQQAVAQKWPFRAVVADSLYGEDRGLRGGLRQLQAPYVLALNPAHAWWLTLGVAGSLRETP
jgi:SRSO17 transposase